MKREEPTDAEGHVIVGRISAPWGVRGELLVEVLTSLPQRFSPGSVVYLEGLPVRVERSRALRGRLVVKLDAVGDRTTAQRLRGKELTVPRASVMPLPEGTYYHFQLLDMAVWTDQGEYLGEIKEIFSTPGNDVYVVRGPEGREVLVPALQDVVVEVRPQEKRMVVRLPEEV